VAHSHSVFGKAFSALGRNLDMITQDACAFYHDVALYASKGIVLDAEEGQAIVTALGNKKAAILRNHGLITCGGTIESCIFWYLALETSCQAQLLADAAASGRGEQTIKISEEDAAYTYRTVGSEVAGWFSAKPVFELAQLQAAQV
jgi:ribulose-5-phosphate 4-epimerase/fuculose-1-phosphate aldolase